MKRTLKKLFGESEEKPEILEEKSEKIKENFHWVLMITPIVSAFLARYFGHIEKSIEIGLVIISIVFNIFLLWLWSYYEYKRTEELRLFRTFWFGKLPPSKKGGELLTNTEIAVIENESNAYYHKKLEEKFKTELVENTLERISIKDENLKFREVLCENFDLSKLDAEKKIQKVKELKDKIENDISKSKVVVVVRTKALDEKPWVYKAVESWANKNSDSPCLFIRNKSESYDDNEIADNFRWIYDEPKILPWKLLQRAKHRSYAWRMQARFNKAMVTNLFALLIMIFLIALSVEDELKADIKTERENISPIFAEQRNSIYRELEDLYKIEESLLQNIEQNESLIDENQNKIKDKWKMLTKQVRDEYKSLYTNLSNNEKLEISYWFTDDEYAQAFTTTEEKPEIDRFKMNGESTIVCVFNNPNHYAKWQKRRYYISSLFLGESKTSVFDFEDNEIVPKIEDNEIVPKKCVTVPRGSNPIVAITCISYNRHNENSKTTKKFTVGICAFTLKTGKNIFREGFDDYLKHRVSDFDKYIYDSLEKNKVKSLITWNGKVYPLMAK